MIELFDHALQIALAIPVRVAERARIDLIDDSAAQPIAHGYGMAEFGASDQGSVASAGRAISVSLRGTTMQKTGFLLVDGNESLKRAAAVPRHWLAAVAMLI